jgi:hypothetical protein
LKTLVARCNVKLKKKKKIASKQYNSTSCSIALQCNVCHHCRLRSPLLRSSKALQRCVRHCCKAHGHCSLPLLQGCIRHHCGVQGRRNLLSL